MKMGGNKKCATYLKAKGVPANAPIKQKYESAPAQLYKEVLKARVEGRPEPTEMPKSAVRSAPSSLNGGGGFRGAGAPAASVGKPGEDPNGMERLTGETEQQYVARQTRLRDEAKARMAKKFGGGGGMGGVGSSGVGGGGGRGRMAGIGSDPNYNPNGGYGVGADLSMDSFVSGFGSALSMVGSAARGAAQTASAAIQDEQTQESLKRMTGSVATTGASLWSSLSSTVSTVASSVSQPDSDGMYDFNQRMASQRPTNSKYEGFGGANATGGGFGGAGAGMGGPSSTLEEAQGLPGEDRNGIERLTGESDEQYVLRQTRLRDEAKARMAAKFGGGGLSAASSSAAPAQSGSYGFAQKPSAPPVRAPAPAPSSGNWGGTGGTAQSRPAKATKMKVESTDDFFANFGA